MISKQLKTNPSTCVFLQLLFYHNIHL